MAALTYFDGHQMAIVPAGTVPRGRGRSAGTTTPATSWSSRRDATAGGSGDRDRAPAAPADGRQQQPRDIFATTLCLVIVVTNIHMRGLWSVLATLGIVSATILFALRAGGTPS